MPRAHLLAALPFLALSSTPLAADPARPEGVIDMGDARAEILARPVPVRRRIELPEGWYEVEEEGVEDRSVGSFTVAPSAASASGEAPSVKPAPAPEPGPEEAAPVASRPAAPDPCLAQRAAYLRELWRESGIDVEDPVALLEGLGGGSTGPAAGFYWFALATDPFRPLAWSSELQSRARDLVRCVRVAAR